MLAIGQVILLGEENFNRWKESL